MKSEGEESAGIVFWEVAYQMPCLLTLNIFGPLPRSLFKFLPFLRSSPPLHIRSEPQ